MAEPARREPRGESEPDDNSSGTVLLQRWIERSDGSMELLEIPLTPADFLDPQLEDTIIFPARICVLRDNLGVEEMVLVQS